MACCRKEKETGLVKHPFSISLTAFEIFLKKTVFEKSLSGVSKTS